MIKKALSLIPLNGNKTYLVALGAVDFSRWYVDEFILDLYQKQPKLTGEQILYMIAWNMRNFNRKDSAILKAVAKMVSAFGSKVGGVFIKKKD